MNTRNRNQPCECGSGKKYKKCCGTPEAVAAREEQERQLALEKLRAKARKQRSSGLPTLGTMAMTSAMIAANTHTYENYREYPVILPKRRNYR